MTYLGDLVNPAHAGEFLESVDLGDQTDNTNGNGPENDEECNEEIDGITAKDDLPPGDVEILPDDVGRLDANGLGIHVKSLVVRDDLVGCLSIGLGVELDKNSLQLVVVAGPPFGLGIINLGHKFVELGTTPLNCVDLFTKKTQRTKSMAGTLLVGNPAGSNISCFGIVGSGSGTFGLGFSRLLKRLDTGLVNCLEQLDLGLFEFHGNLVTLFDHLIQLGSISADPDILDRVVEHATDTPLIEILLGNRREENSTGRDALSILGVEQIGLAQVDVKDALASDHVHEKAVNGPGDKGMRKQGVLVRVEVDITVREDLELRLVVTTSGIDGKQNRKGNASANQADNEADAQVTNKEIGVETLVCQCMGVRNLPKCADPVEPAAGHARSPLTVTVSIF